MKVHRIHDLSDENVVNLLEQGLNHVTEGKSWENYSPEMRHKPSNLFYVLKHGRYKKGSYFVVEKDGEYVCSAGWNEYTIDTALVLTRAYVSKPYRTQYLMASLLLPTMIEETSGYKHTWITCNKDHGALYQWFVRSSQGKQPAMFSNWPPIYERFLPIGEKTVYFTEQLVAELERN